MTAISGYVDRNEKIIGLVRKKNVLHVGCIGFADSSVDEKVSNSEKTLHAAITKSAANAIGIDNDCQTIAELNDLGVFENVICGDAERLSEIRVLDNKKLDIVVAGDIIEHLSNPGLMLDGIRNLIDETGVLVVSTPNSFGFVAWIKFMFNRFKEGEQHVLCFNEITLEQLLVRHGFRVSEALSCFHPQAKERFGLGFAALRKVLGLFPRFGGTLIYVCKIDPKSY